MSDINKLSGWTLETLKAFFDERTRAVEKAAKQRSDELESAHRRQREDDRMSREKVELALDKRLESMNEFRNQLRQQTNDFVRRETHESMITQEKLAREAALLRVDEKFDEYVKRYEQRQREVDTLLSIQKGAADEARHTALEQARKTNRNIALVGAVLGVLVFVLNLLPYLSPAPG